METDHITTEFIQFAIKSALQLTNLILSVVKLYRSRDKTPKKKTLFETGLEQFGRLLLKNGNRIITEIA